MNLPAARVAGPAAAGSLAARLQRSWYQPRRPPWPLRVLAWLFGRLVAGRRALYRRGWLRSERLPVPVVVIGNLTVGGAGKTPLAIAIAQWLQAGGRRPGVVSRGYGRRDPDARLVHPGDAADQVGDEPVLFAAAGIPVAVARRRADAARLLLRGGCDLILADDGLQHLALARDVEILVVDGRRRFGNGALLPAGPLREPAARARACDLRVVNGGRAEADEFAMQLRIDRAVPLQGASGTVPLAQFAARPVHAVAGIGDPARFFDALRACGLDVLEHPFPDHHAYAAGELRFEPPLPVLMTAKDAVKCRPFAQPHWYEVPAKAELPDAFFAALDRLLDGTAAQGAH